MLTAPRGHLIDGHGRRITYVRISVTDRCNLQCVYCIPEGQRLRAMSSLMTRDEIVRASRLLSELGVEKVRITGGEPTARPDLVDVVADLAAIGFPGGIALSTNGVLFPRIARKLRAAGLTRVNVSLDAATAEHFRKVTGRDHLDQVLRSIEMALELSFEAVKVNSVVVRGLNDDQIVPLAAMTYEKPLAVRFIEYMPFGANAWTPSDWMGWEEVRERLTSAGYVLDLVERAPSAGPADEYRVRSDRGEHRGRVGFITPISDRFCDTCNRIRLTQDGFLKGCLFGHGDVDLLTPMRAGGSDDDMAMLVKRAAQRKEERHPMSVGVEKTSLPLAARSMSELGG